MTEPSTRDQAGFALLEFLAGFAILSISVAWLLAAATSSMRADRRSAFVAVATSQANSVLNAASAVAPLVIGRTSGSFEDGHEWEVTSSLAKQYRDGDRVLAEIYWLEARVSHPARAREQAIVLRRMELSIPGSGRRGALR